LVTAGLGGINTEDEVVGLQDVGHVHLVGIGIATDRAANIRGVDRPDPVATALVTVEDLETLGDQVGDAQVSGRVAVRVADELVVELAGTRAWSPLSCCVSFARLGPWLRGAPIL
jgi:hypothetical protein